jgi:transposase
VERVAVCGLSAGAVARELGLHETVLRRWMLQFGAQATGAAWRPTTQAPAPSPSDLAAEVARLRRENERLRMERDILKKAALIFGAASR